MFLTQTLTHTVPLKDIFVKRISEKEAEKTILDHNITKPNEIYQYTEIIFKAIVNVKENLLIANYM